MVNVFETEISNEQTEIVQNNFYRMNSLFMAAHICWVVIYIVLNTYWLVIPSAAAVIGHIFYLYFIRKNKLKIFYLIILIQTTILVVIATYSVGWEAGYHYYFLIFPSFAFILLAKQQKYLIIILTAIIYFILYFTSVPITDLIDPDSIDFLFSYNLISWFIIVVFISSLYNKTNLSIHNTLVELTKYDSLTETYNRRTMYAYIEKERLKKKKLFLLLIDLDDFKKINDQFGHPCGDAVLIYSAGIFKKIVGKKGSVSRWGGEEFMVMIEGDSLEEARELSENILMRINQEAFIYKGQHVWLTITAGLTVYEEDLSIDEAIHQADQALYVGKESGKNQVIIYEAKMESQNTFYA